MRNKPSSSAAVKVAFDSDKSTRLKIDFMSKRHIYYAISIVLILAGIIVSIFTIKLDIMFKGGAIIQYSYTGTVDVNDAQSIAAEQLKTSVTVSTKEGTDGTILVIQAEKGKGNWKITSDMQSKLIAALTEKFADNDIKIYQTSVVDPEMGSQFLLQSIGAVLLASAIILIYIWFRFRKIGGLPAGTTALIALLHDILMVFAAYAIFQIPLNDSFIAVTLTILGYSINDTIVIFDRIRENRTTYGKKIPFKDVVNRSINQSFVRSLNTTVSTFVAIAVVLIFAVVFHLDSIFKFALPMMVGVVTGCYSTICIAGPLWVDWVTHKEKKNSAAGGASKKLVAKKA